ncbi:MULTISPECIES: hypothetical protein [unclassified Burkholderia]|uniref:hypothetical protein n=1 Tax=unclassified Burkholderia TaxID=2613784 RepID=UPI000F5674E9|nr:MULTISPECIES: hypothetical protein [unclassified Burkholderia]
MTTTDTPRAAAVPADQGQWRELARRLYVELFHCDLQMRSTRDEDGEPHWTQSAVVRDVLADAKAALDGAPQPAQADARVGLTDEQRSDIHAAIRAIAEYSDEIKASNVTASGTWCDAYEEQAYESYVALLTRLRAILAAHPSQPEPRAEVTDVQWWLAELDQYGNPKLSDGAHSERAGADKAMYLIKSLGLDNKGKRWAVARVELSEPRPNADGVNAGAVESCRAMVDAARVGGA